MTTEMEREWYILREGKRYGPFSDADLDRFRGAQQLQPTDLLWHRGLSGWQPASTLFATTQRSAPPPPDPAPKKRGGNNRQQLAQRLLSLKDRFSSDEYAWHRRAMVLFIVLLCGVLIGVIGSYIFRLLVE
jgi:hypothetical protein